MNYYQLNPVETLILSFRRWKDWKGRSVRSEFIVWCLFWLNIMAVLALAVLLIHGKGEGLVGALLCTYGAMALVMCIPHISLTLRRFHDLGYGIVAFVIAFAAVLGAGIVSIPLGALFKFAIGIWLCCAPSDEDNEYGPKP